MGMKTAVSIPDEIFAAAERLARTLRTSRSQLYANALQEFIARHDPDHVTAALDEIHADEGAKDNFLSETTQRTLDRNEW